MSHKQTGLGFERAYCGTENRPFDTGRQSLHRQQDRLVTVRGVIERSGGRHLPCCATDWLLNIPKVYSGRN